MTDHPYVIIDTAGRAENVKNTYGWFDILDTVYSQVQSAGGNTPLPSMLLKGGKVIVPSGLHDIAWKYGQARHEAVRSATARVMATFPEPIAEGARS